MSEVPLVKLNNGVEIPAIGLGCWSGRTPEEWAKCVPWILTAIKAGYRHLDTAKMYGTEKYVAEAIRQSGIPREEFFVTTKLPSHHHGKVELSIDESLASAGLTYYDLYLMHWPMAFVDRDDEPYPLLPDGTWAVAEHPDFSETWASMEALLKTGKVRAIGVSNFSIKTLEVLLKTAKVVPAVNQVELHPLVAQNDLLEYSKSKGIILTAYSPTGYAAVRENPEVQKIAAKHGAGVQQIPLAWHIQRGTTAVPKSADPVRQRENLYLPKLDEEDMKVLNSLDQNKRQCNYPGGVDKPFGWTYEQLGW